MGISIGVSKDSYPSGREKYEGLFSKWKDKVPEPMATSGGNAMSPNPDPERWHIMEARQIGHSLVVKLYYPGCTNYEGNKVMVYEYCTIHQLKAQKRIDPHFSDNPDYRSPVGRFEPTKRGWEYACAMAHMLNIVHPNPPLSTGRHTPNGPA